MLFVHSAVLILGPQIGILVWWLLDPIRWNVAFTSFIWPLLGSLFLPCTTLMYVAVVPIGGVTGFDGVWLGITVVADTGMYAGGGYGNRDRLLAR